MDTDSASVVTVVELHQILSIPDLDSGELIEIKRIGIVRKQELFRAPSVCEWQVIPQACIHDVFLCGVYNMVVRVCDYNVQWMFLVIGMAVAAPSTVILWIICTTHRALDKDKFHCPDQLSFTQVMKHSWSPPTGVVTHRDLVDLGPNSNWFIFGSCVWKFERRKKDN